jgi:EAL domain-containing protein (putative c-di-GMP-specific phosphodiesterase class I)
VVEDSHVQRRHVLDVLAGLGAEGVKQAVDGVEGLATLAAHPEIDLVITDLEMPRMDGIRFIGEFAARGFRPQLVITSSHDQAVLHSVRLMAETYGLVVPGIIRKPMDPETMRRILDQPPLHAPGGPKEARGDSGRPDLDDIRAGLRDGAFIAWFQPQVTLKGALLKGVEALARWQHPVHGLLGPAAFLPLAETDAGTMSRLTHAILADVAGHWQQWKRRGLALDMSVNLSALSLGQPGFAEELAETCEELALPPKSLVLEVTESSSMANLAQCLGNLARLRMRGFRLSIDDFGTGFATFQQLDRVPFTELKIDRSITRHLPGGDRHRLLADGVLKLARGLGLGTVAEGIETLEAFHALRQMGCDLAQGYLVARPMPGAQLLDWAKQDRTFLRN